MKETRRIPMERPVFREHPGPRCPTHGAYHQALDACPVCTGPLPAITATPGLAACCKRAIQQAIAKWPADQMAASRAKGELRGNPVATPQPGFHALCGETYQTADGRTHRCRRSITWDGTTWRRSEPKEHKYTVEG